MDDNNEFLMTSSCCTIVDKKDHVQYLTVSKNYSRRMYMFFDWTEYSDKRS